MADNRLTFPVEMSKCSWTDKSKINDDIGIFMTRGNCEIVPISHDDLRGRLRISIRHIKFILRVCITQFFLLCRSLSWLWKFCVL